MWSNGVTCKHKVKKKKRAKIGSVWRPSGKAAYTPNLHINLFTISKWEKAKRPNNWNLQSFLNDTILTPIVSPRGTVLGLFPFLLASHKVRFSSFPVRATPTDLMGAHSTSGAVR